MENNAEEQLALVAATRARVAERLTTPWWYPVSLGALMAGLVLAIGLGLESWWYAAVVALVLIGEGIIVRAYRNVVGVWSTTWDDVPSWTIWTGFGVALVLLAAAAAVRIWTALVWPAWALAAAMFVLVMVLGRWSDAAWRARLRGSV